uniref:Secreted protein n=1 Tax=Anopheles merus TaxID=30066 RepID=A0A182UTF1_ANOME
MSDAASSGVSSSTILVLALAPSLLEAAASSGWGRAWETANTANRAIRTKANANFMPESAASHFLNCGGLLRARPETTRASSSKHANDCPASSTRLISTVRLTRGYTSSTGMLNR